MDRGVVQSSLVQQMMGESLSWWSSNNMRTPIEQTYPLLPSSSSSSSTFSGLQYPQPSNFLEVVPWHDNQDVPVSWNQRLLGGLAGEEVKGSLSSFQAKKMPNLRDQLICPSTSAHMIDVKQEISEIGCVYRQGSCENEVARSFRSQIVPASSPKSCVTTSSSSSILDFSNSKSETRHPQTDHSSECNSTESGSASKKARIQASSAQSTLKVRKEKLGDRITALHQLVSPFGKTDTTSVLQEAIGYIRFLHNQIEALSSPYLGTGESTKMSPHACSKNLDCWTFQAQGEKNYPYPEDFGQEVGDEEKKDLRSRGLCLVPVFYTSHFYSLDGADYWALALGEGFP